MRKNEDIRRILKERKVTQWETAAELGVSDMTLQRWLRFELPAEKKEMVLKAIDTIVAERKGA